MKPIPLTPRPDWHHLPRLSPEFYRGFAVVHWTITLERRAKGWLNDLFHSQFRGVAPPCGRARRTVLSDIRSHARPYAFSLDGPPRAHRPAERDEVPSQTSGDRTVPSVTDRRGVRVAETIP